MKVIVVLMIAIVAMTFAIDNETCPNSRNGELLLSRKRRALSFPQGSNFIITISLVKAILIGVPLGWNIALEVDVPFKASGLKDILRYKFHRHRLHNRQRRELLRGMENALSASGLNGKACILRTICEAPHFLAPKNTNFMHDILRIILKAPDNGGPQDVYAEAKNTTDCNKYHGDKKCPFSLLGMLVSQAGVIK